MRWAAVNENQVRVVTIRELMHEKVLSAEPDTPVAAAAASMVREKAGSTLIMQGGFLVGILTERDVVQAAASGEDLTKAPVAEWMTREPQSAAPDTPAEEAAQIMLRNGFRHLPVADGRQVRGIVSLRDLFAAMIRRPAR
jgi:CBS domain-containing protein